ncbi:hypothetical protein CGLO_00579 [Colletotrichum gloeosporioides Cg-14]|uniref:Uncharacterized protein n=1 Tax=Colletotrichum gloeosporioides (strain Cg-14) TaxID=1237896 RepID=T0KU87_COLGC|nr:hypothetical protein CGLO_00579 [Colletotrichum gloeosporioides Cg-14]
MGPSGSEVELN